MDVTKPFVSVCMHRSFSRKAGRFGDCGITDVDAMMPFMRTTVRIDDELLLKLKAQAAREHISLTRLLNRTLRTGLQASRKPGPPKRPYHEKTFAMGAPLVGLDKALALASSLEDEEIVRKMMLRK
jgi:hypothetical protein